MLNRFRSLALILTGLACLLVSDYASAMYDPGAGRFLQRDPAGYPDGMNSYGAYHVMRGGVDPSGMATVNYKINAFIDAGEGKTLNAHNPAYATYKKSRSTATRTYVNNAEALRFFGSTYLYPSSVLGVFTRSNYFYRTDNRAAGVAGTSRASFEFEIECERPNARPIVHTKQFTNDATFEVQARVSGELVMSKKTANFNPQIDVNNTGNNSIKIEFEASAGDPFVLGAPELNMDGWITARCCDLGKLWTRVELDHDDFPDFEILKNDRLVKHYDASASGKDMYSIAGPADNDLNFP